MKRLFLTLLASAVMGVATTWAETYKLHISLKDGTVEEVELSQKPLITFGEGTLNISTTDFQCALSDIERFGFVKGGGATGIGEAAVDMYFNITGAAVTATGISETDRVAVYDIRGVEQSVDIIRNAGTVTVAYGSLPHGIYIVKIGPKTLKITKR